MLKVVVGSSLSVTPANFYLVEVSRPSPYSANKNPVEDSYFGKTEVSNDYMPFGVKEYVLWLQISEKLQITIMIGGIKSACTCRQCCCHEGKRELR